MTEETAKTKWCPQARIQHVEIYADKALPGGAAHNRQWVHNAHGEESGKALYMKDSAHCIASECMMWRWENVNLEKHQPHDKGYCGLAGRPND